MPSSAWNIDAVRSREAMVRVFAEIGEDLDWKDVLIAHLDTGYTEHVVFNLDSNRPALMVDRGINYMEGVGRPEDPLDYAGPPTHFPGHGTRTLGTLCGNLPGTYVGVCPTVPIVPYRVTNGSVLTNGRIVNVANAIRHAVDENAARVISISLGANSLALNKDEMHEMGSAVDHAYEAGVIICGAAGQIQDAPELVGFTVYPGRYSRSILCGGINAKRKVCFDYEVGASDVDVWAPADDVRRPNAVLGASKPYLDTGHLGDGTSYATVHVAGAAAMWLRMRGAELDQGGYTGWQRVEAFRAMLRNTFRSLQGNDVPTRKNKVPSKTGILDCVELLDAKLPKLDKLKKAPLARPQVD
jgi:subtilisin family serine protease